MMITKRIVSCLASALLLVCTAGPVLAAEVDCDGIYCFQPEDFSREELAGVCITQVPEESLGAVMLGQRQIRPGDILTAAQLAQMTFAPVRTQEDRTVSVSYLPIYEDRVETGATMTISIRGKEDKAPAVEDFAAETYKNLPLEGALKVKDPENQAMTYTLVRAPKRGEVTIREDGSFTYTPKKNKVGIDSFVYTATDPAGNVSREATVTVTIVKPTDATQYTDTLGQDCRFAAEWMKNTGIFVGEKLDGNACFSPDREVSRGEFLTMVVKTLDIPTQEASLEGVYADEIPLWLQPYLAAAVRAGLTAGITQGEVFGANQPITGAEAAQMIQNALDLPQAAETLASEDAAGTLSGYGICLESGTVLTRGQAAVALYQVCQLAQDAPGMRALGGLQ